MTVTRRTRTLLAGAIVAVAGAALAVALPASAATQPSHHTRQATHAGHATKPRPVTTGSRYLALGDSISFGYREPTNKPTPNYHHAGKFVGFPELVGQELGLHVANAACPGETSASLNNKKARSYDCESGPSGSGPGYRTAYPLHVKYGGSQLAYGVHYLRSHKNTRLVTLMIGANDGFLCQATTKDGCTSSAELTALVNKIEKNVARTLKTIRNKAHYTGQIVIVNYYSTNYKDALGSLSSRIVNNALDTGAKPYHVKVVNTYALFHNAAKQAGGDTCTAGLLTTLSGGGCGVHPSVAGQSLLAYEVVRALKK